MQHFIWVSTVHVSTHSCVSDLQRVQEHLIARQARLLLFYCPYFHAGFKIEHNDCYSYLAAGMTAILQRWEGVKTEVLKNYDNPANMVNRFNKPASVKIGKL